MKKIFYFLLFIFMSLITGCIPDEGVYDFATIGGRIYDMYSDEPITGVRVLTVPDSKEVITDSAGYYCFYNLEPGKYSLKAEKNSSEYFVRHVKTVIVNKERLTAFNIPVTVKFIFVEARPELDHNFYMSAYEFTNGETTDALTNRIDDPWAYDSTSFLPYALHIQPDTYQSSRQILHWIYNYCNQKSLSEGLTPCYSNGVCDYKADGYRLPTVDEWLYAAKGGKKSKGFLYSGSNNPDEVAWYQSNSTGRTRTCGKKTPNELGLHDLSGNVIELCFMPGGNSFDVSLIRYMGGSYLSGRNDLPYSIIKKESKREISEPGVGIRLVRTAK